MQQQFQTGQQRAVMMQPPPKAAAYQQKRGPEQPQTYPLNYSNNSVPTFSPTAPISYPPQMTQQQKLQTAPQNGNGNINNGQGKLNSYVFVYFWL